MVPSWSSWYSDTTPLHSDPCHSHLEGGSTAHWREDNRLAFSYVQAIYPSVQYPSDPSMVSLLSMVVQRGLCVVTIGRREPELGSSGQVSISGAVGDVYDPRSNLNRSYERPRLNERPIYLRSIFLTLALIQSVLHLYYDYDRVILPVTKTKREIGSDQPPHITVPPLEQLRTRLPHLLQRAVPRALSILILGPLVYSIFLRRIAWSWSLFLAKILWNLSKSSEPPTIPPYHISILIRSVTSSFLLVFLWEISNGAFEAYVAQEPLKNDKPLTSDSRDPNGSLLTGLNAKKEVPKVINPSQTPKETAYCQADIRILGVSLHQPQLPRATKALLRRHRPQKRRHMDPNPYRLSHRHPKHEHPHHRLPNAIINRTTSPTTATTTTTTTHPIPPPHLRAPEARQHLHQTPSPNHKTRNYPNERRHPNQNLRPNPRCQNALGFL